MSSYGETIRRYQRNNILLSVLVELTYRCNLDCTFCHNDADSTGIPMTTAEYFRFFEELRDMQVLNLALSGGEPLAHPDFFTLGAKAHELGFVVRIKSNGHAIRSETARRIKDEIDPFLVEISLHGACSETHDRQTRVPGSFAQLMSHVQEMKRIGLRIRYNAVLTRWNENEIGDMFALADAMEVPLQVDPEVTPRDNGDTGPLDLTASDDGLRNLYRLQLARRRIRENRRAASEVERQTDEEMPAPEDKQCGAGSSGVAVDPFGNVYPCVQFRRPVGNLHESSIQHIWHGSPRLDEIRDLMVTAKKFVEDQRTTLPLLRFCVGCALLSTGDPLRTYSAIERSSRIWNEVQEEKGVAASRAT